MKTLQQMLDRHYQALETWLLAAFGQQNPEARHLLAEHRAWLEPQLVAPQQPWLEWLPMGLEVSAKWLPEGVHFQRFILGTSLDVLALPLGALAMPDEVRTEILAMRQQGQRPRAVQLGLAGQNRRLYLEGGTLQVPMIAWEWDQTQHVQRRQYRQHEAQDLQPLGQLDPLMRQKWLEFQEKWRPQAALLREDTPGQAVAIHIQLQRPQMSEVMEDLLQLAELLAVPRAQANAWLQRLPVDARLSVLALGRDAQGRLHLTVYVQPDPRFLPQPGPPPGDLRRHPGTILWPLAQSPAHRPHAWLLFAPPDVGPLPRPAAQSPTVQIWASSQLPQTLPQEILQILPVNSLPLLTNLQTLAPRMEAVLERHDLWHVLPPVE